MPRASQVAGGPGIGRWKRFFPSRKRGQVPAADATGERERLARITSTLAELSRELGDWVPFLQRLAETEALRDLAIGHYSEITGPVVRSVIAARRLRDDHFWPLMNEAAWALLLELYACRLEGERQGVEGVSAGTGIPLDTCLHWIDWLTGRGLAFRNGPNGSGTELVDLTDTGADRMQTYLFAALKLSPWVE